MDQDDDGWIGLDTGGDGALGLLLDRLTPPQRRLLHLVAEGCTDTEIARVLGLTRGEVTSTKRLAFRCAGVRRRSQVVLWWRVTGGDR